MPPPPFDSGSLIKGGRGTLAGERGGGRVPIPTRGHTAWYSLYIYVLCGNIGCRRLSDRYDISDPRRAPKHIFMAKIAAVERLKRVNGTIFTISK